jgi:ribose transport system permease protein
MKARRRLLVPLIGLVLVLAAIGIISPASLAPVSFLASTKNAAYLGVVAIGQTLVMLTGGIDLSLYETIALTDIFTANFMHPNAVSIVSVTLLAILLAAAIGVVNGTMIAKTGIPPIIMTIAMGFAIRGSYLVLTKGAPRGNVPEILRYIGRGRVLDLVPIATLVWLALSFVAILILRRTTAGRAVYYTGSNATAARLSGISTDATIIFTYMASSVFAAFAGLLISGFIGSGTLDAGVDYMLSPIAASVIGGTTFAGGIGGIGGTIIGTLIMRNVDNLMTILKTGHAGKLIVQGAIIGGIATLYSLQRPSK